MATSFPWTCPYCNRDTTITTDYREFDVVNLIIDNADGYRRVAGQFIVCPNKKCKKFTLIILLQAITLSGGEWIPVKTLETWRLIPPSKARVFPDYIPEAIREDYQEACQIADLSAKASATLSRRCLQGMIKDYWNVKKTKLGAAIDALKSKVTPTAWKAIDGVRKIGNIGAHMEKDINLIIDVDPDEAKKLIWLIEYLLDDWYIRRHDEELRLSEIAAIAENKDQQRKDATSSIAAPARPAVEPQ